MENETNECRCGYVGDNFSPSQMTKGGKCRACRKEDALDWNTRNNPTHNPNRNDHFSKKYPTPHPKCVYAIKEGDEILYVGESEKSSYRIYEHLNRNAGAWTGSPFCHMTIDDRKKYSYEILWHGDNDMMRKIQEKTLIMKHQPKFNKVYKQYKDE